MQLCVVDRDGGLRGDAGQHVQVFLREPLALIAGVDLNHAERAAFAIDQRCAHDRANAQVGDTLAGVEPRVAGGVGRENRLFAVEDLADDRAADAHLVFHAGTAMFDRLGHQHAFGRAQHDEPAIGLDENLEQAVEQFAEHFFLVNRFAEVLGDFDHRAT